METNLTKLMKESPRKKLQEGKSNKSSLHMSNQVIEILNRSRTEK